MDLKIGYKASTEQFGARDLVEYAVRAEAVGLDGVWVSDHFLPWRHKGGHAPSALAWMAAVGERTQQVAKRWIVASDPDEAVAQITPYLEVGFSRLVFHGPGHDQERFLTQLAEDIVPRLRGW